MESRNDDSLPDPHSGTIWAIPLSEGKSSAEPIRDVQPNPARDAEHLRLLSIFHYVVAGITGLGSLFPVLHLVMGIAIVTGQLTGGGSTPTPVLGWIFILGALTMILCGLALAIAIAVAGHKLQSHTSYTYCLVIAALECLLMPFGVVLGVFTIIVLLRPTVKERFGVPAAAET